MDTDQLPREVGSVGIGVVPGPRRNTHTALYHNVCKAGTLAAAGWLCDVCGHISAKQHLVSTSPGFWRDLSGPLVYASAEPVPAEIPDLEPEPELDLEL